MGKQNQEKFSLASYNYPKEIYQSLFPISTLLKKNRVRLAERNIARLALNVCDKVKNRTMSKKEADRLFTLLYIYIGDNFQNIRFSRKVCDLIFELQFLHDLGNKYGADLKSISKLAKGILRKKIVSNRKNSVG